MHGALIITDGCDLQSEIAEIDALQRVRLSHKHLGAAKQPIAIQIRVVAGGIFDDASATPYTRDPTQAEQRSVGNGASAHNIE